MANQLGAPGVSPRSYVQHMRYALYGRIRHAKQFPAFLAAHAARLTTVPGATTAAKKASVFESLTENTADQVKKAAHFSDLVS